MAIESFNKKKIFVAILLQYKYEHEEETGDVLCGDEFLRAQQKEKRKKKEEVES